MNAVAENFTKTTQQAAENFNVIARESVDVVLKSASAASKGWDEATRSASELAQENLNRAVTAGKTILSAKSPREAMDLQTEFLRESLEHFVANTSILSEISARIARDAIEPVTQHTSNVLSRVLQRGNRAA